SPSAEHSPTWSQCPLSARSRRSPMLRNRHHPLRKHTSPPWCARHGLEPLPASAETVAAYSGVRCDQDLEKNSVVSHLTVAVHELLRSFDQVTRLTLCPVDRLGDTLGAPNEVVRGVQL